MQRVLLYSGLGRIDHGHSNDDWLPGRPVPHQGPGPSQYPVPGYQSVLAEMDLVRFSPPNILLLASVGGAKACSGLTWLLKLHCDCK
jgi:hypothetical protein